MSGTIGYLDAWATWWDGQQVDPELGLGPLSVRWWGRLGKIAAFVGGGTVVLDLIGPDRLRQLPRAPRLGRVARTSSRVWRYAMITFWVNGAFVLLAGLGFMLFEVVLGMDARLLFGIVIGAVVLVWVLLLVIAGSSLLLALPRALAAVLDTDRPAQVVRYLALGLLVVGFHLDLLAS